MMDNNWFKASCPTGRKQSLVLVVGKKNLQALWKTSLLVSAVCVVCSNDWCRSCEAPCTSVMLNCSQPNQPALLEALRPVFNLRSIRPVMNLSTPTFVGIDFIIFAILGVVRDATLTYNLSLIIHQISDQYLFCGGCILHWASNENAKN